MLEIVDSFKTCRALLNKTQPTDMINELYDMNTVSFFNSKNIKRLNEIISDPCDGSYRNLNYLTTILCDIKTMEHSKHETVFGALYSYVISFCSTINKTIGIEKNLFITDKDINNKELIYVMFGIVLVNKHKKG